MSELLPCPDPWCPTNKEGELEFGDEPICVRQLYGGFAVQCAICELSGPHKRTEAEAATAWNTRTESLASRNRTIGELVGALERLASMETMTMPRAINPEYDTELLARINFTEDALRTITKKGHL